MEPDASTITGLDPILDAAAAEWKMQADLPDGEPSRMSPEAREAYLMQRLIGHLHTLLVMTGRI